MKTVCMIPARLGSSRVKKKNLRLINGKPLISYIIDTVKQCDCFDEIYLNSEALIFKEIADQHSISFYKRCGWEPPGKELNERQEMDKRRQYAVDQGANKEAMDVLDRICLEYKEKYI